MVKQNCRPNVVTYTSLIDGFCRRGDSVGAEKLFEKMKHCGLMPNVVTYSILIGGFCKEGKLPKAASSFEQMLMSKCNPNEATFHYLVNGFSNNASNMVCSREGLHQHKQSTFLDFFCRMISDGLIPRIAAYSSILVCLCLSGMLDTALQLSEKMVTRGCLSKSITFAALLHGICLEGRSKEWKDLISCNLNEAELSAALKYSLILELYIPHGASSEASSMLHVIVKQYKSNLQEVDCLQASIS